MAREIDPHHSMRCLVRTHEALNINSCDTTSIEKLATVWVLRLGDAALKVCTGHTTAAYKIIMSILQAVGAVDYEFEIYFTALTIGEVNLI